MELLFLLTLITLFALIAASYNDLKTKEVPDWISYGLIIVASFYYIIESIYLKNLSVLFVPIINAIICYGLGSLMYYSRQWGGGDAKLLIGVGISISTYPIYLKEFFNPFFGEMPLVAIFFVNLLITGAIYGIIWSFLIAFKHHKQFLKEFKSQLSKTKIIRLLTLVFCLLFIIVSLLLKNDLSYLVILLALLLLVMVYLSIFVKSVESSSMFVKIPISKLTEGDWVIEPIKHNKSVLYNPSNIGITLDQLKLIKSKLSKNNLVTVKEGIPFIPSFLIAYVITLIFGNFIFIFI